MTGHYRSSSPEEILRIGERGDKYHLVDFLCYKSDYQSEVINTGGVYVVQGRGMKFTVHHPYTKGDIIHFREHYKMVWWPAKFNKVAFMYRDNRVLIRKAIPEELALAIRDQVRRYYAVQNKRLMKHFKPHHFIKREKFWMSPLTQPDEAIRLTVEVVSTEVMELKKFSREHYTAAGFQTRNEFIKWWNKKYGSIGIRHDRPMFVWVTRIRIKKFSKGVRRVPLADKNAFMITEPNKKHKP